MKMLQLLCFLEFLPQPHRIQEPQRIEPVVARSELDTMRSEVQ
jgi:hypothetical protein